MDGYVVIGTELDTKSFDAQINYIENQLEEIQEKLKQADMGFDVGDTAKLEAQYEKLGNQLEQLKNKQIALNRTDLKNAEKSINKIGDATTKTIKKVGRWVLAKFSVRSAYTAISSAMSTLSQYNEQFANQINTIRLVFASALEPIVTRLVDLVYRLLTYVNYIAKAWFNVDLFASASAMAMKNGAKNAEKMRKSMAGFDEMNVVSDNSGGSASAGSGFVAPEDAPIPSWIKWIAENKDLVIGGLLGIGTALLLLNLGGLVTNLSGIGTLLSIIWGILQPLFTFIGANATVIGGIILIVGGLALAIQGLINYLKDPTWENFGVMLTGI